MRHFGIGKRLFVGFSILVTIIAFSLFNSIFQFKNLQLQSDIVIDNRIPTAMASSSILNGVNHALAALRGWMILGDTKFKLERKSAWDSEIYPALSVLNEKAANWTNPENLKRLKKLKILLVQFEEEQKRIEDIAQTIKNIPSLEMLYVQAVPQAKIMSKNISLMIDLEMQLEATKERKAILGMMADIRGTLGLSLANIRGYLLSGEENYKSTYEALWDKNSRRYEDLNNNTQLLSPAQKNAFQQFNTARALFNSVPVEMLKLRSRDDWNIANYWLSKKAAPIGFEIKKIIDNMANDQALLLASDANLIKQITLSTIKTNWILMLFGISIGLAISIFITRGIVNPIRHLESVMLKVDDKSDLTLRASDGGKDEIQKISNAFNNTLSGLHLTLSNVTNANNQIAESLGSTSETASQASNSIIQQQVETEQLAKAMSEMSLTINEIAKNTSKTSIYSNEAKNSIDNGMSAMQSTISTINDLAGIIGNTGSTVSELEKRTTDISSVLDVITGIADQTNLLALNAAIEAARAGEQGRGFAVVADEVRALASRTSEATTEISQIIGQLQNGSKQAVSSMISSQDQVSSVVDLANTTKSALINIEEVISRISSMTEQNAIATEEQSAVSNNISMNVSSINEASEQTSNAAKKNAETSKDLAKFASGLNDLVKDFKL